MNKEKLKDSILISAKVPVTVQQLNKLYFMGTLVKLALIDLIKANKIKPIITDNQIKYFTV